MIAIPQSSNTDAPSLGFRLEDVTAGGKKIKATSWDWYDAAAGVQSNPAAFSGTMVDKWFARDFLQGKMRAGTSQIIRLEDKPRQWADTHQFLTSVFAGENPECITAKSPRNKGRFSMGMMEFTPGEGLGAVALTEHYRLSNERIK